MSINSFAPFLTSMPFSIIAQSVSGNWLPGSAGSQSSFAKLNRKVEGHKNDTGSNQNSQYTDLWMHQTGSHRLTWQCKNSLFIFQDSSKQNMWGTVPKLQHHFGQKRTQHLYFDFDDLPQPFFFWILYWQDLHNKKQLPSNQSNSFHGSNLLLWQTPTDIHCSHRKKLFCKFFKRLPPNHVILIPFPQNCCMKILTFFFPQPPTSSTLPWPLMSYHNLEHCDRQTPAKRNKQKNTSSDKNVLKNYRPILNLPFLFKSFKKSFYTNSLHISKKATS